MGNQNSGRRPQPTALKVLRGNPGQRRINIHELVSPPGEVTKPAGLSTGAGAVWDELAPICLAMKVLSPADARAFRTLCELQATLDVAFQYKDGRTLIDLQPDINNESRLIVVIDGVLKFERDAANAVRPYYEYFGLTPSSRARLAVPKQKDEPASKWAGHLK